MKFYEARCISVVNNFLNFFFLLDVDAGVSGVACRAASIASASIRERGPEASSSIGVGIVTGDMAAFLTRHVPLALAIYTKLQILILYIIPVSLQIKPQ